MLMLLLVLKLVLISIMKNDHKCCVINLNENDEFWCEFDVEKNGFKLVNKEHCKKNQISAQNGVFLPFCAQNRAPGIHARVAREILDFSVRLRAVCAPFARRAQLFLPKISKIVLSITFDTEVRFRCSKMRFEAYQITFSNKWNDLHFVQLSPLKFWKVHRVVKWSGVAILVVMKQIVVMMKETYFGDFGVYVALLMVSHNSCAFFGDEEAAV